MKNQLKKLRNIIESIEDVNKDALMEADKRMTSLAKPLKSLGKLEEIAIKLSGITGKVKNDINKRMVIIMCSDNGVVEEGVASAPQSVTLAQTINFTKGVTGVAVLAKANKTELMVVDVGINCDFNHPNVINKKIRKATYNLSKGPAMSYEEAIKAMLIGIEAVKDAKSLGYEILGVGEMGIGNTSTSSAVLSALTDIKVEDVVGRGGGITDETFEWKKEVIKKALEINKPIKDDP